MQLEPGCVEEVLEVQIFKCQNALSMEVSDIQNMSFSHSNSDAPSRANIMNSSLTEMGIGIAYTQFSTSQFFEQWSHF
jgi:hypothetical protein